MSSFVNKTIRVLNFYYYTMMVLTLLAAVLMYYLLSHALFVPFDIHSQAATIIQYIVIFDALITIPLGLYGCKYFCQRLVQSHQPNEANKTDAPLTIAITPEICSAYKRYAALRIVLVSNVMVLGILAYYALACYPSMMWVAAIGAIGWYFTKPTEAKMRLELTPKDPSAETY